MQIVRQWQNYPFLRLVLPLMAGIGAGEALWAEWLAHRAEGEQSTFLNVGLFILFALLFLLIFLYRRKRRGYADMSFGLAFTLFLVLLGAWLDTQKWHSSEQSWLDEAVGYEAVLVDVPQEKAKTYLCPVVLTARFEAGRKIPLHSAANIYLSKDTIVPSFSIGDAFRFAAQLSRPRNSGNPDEFDYANYLLRHNVQATGFVRVAAWRHIPSSAETLSLAWWTRLKMRALKYRTSLLQTYRRHGLAENELGVLAAMTLGDKTWLSDETRELYAAAGASHVLALSGLHLGILYMVLNMLLLGKWHSRRIRCLSQLLIIAALWTFVLLTGMPLSLIRSALMYTMLSIGILCGQKNVSVNTLALAAFIMLIFNPFALSDVGFQLSFMAVLSILLLDVQRWGIRLPRQPILRYICSLLSVSLAAQIGVAPLTIYYFNRFPPYFLLTNLWVVPLAFVLVSGALLFFALSFWPWAQSWVALGIGKVVGLMNGGLLWLNQLPGASLNQLYPSLFTVCGLYLCFAFVLLFLKWRRTRYLKGALLAVVAIIWASVFVKMANPFEPALIFYNNRDCPAVHFISSRHRSYLLADGAPDSVLLRFRYIQQNFWWRRDISTPVVVSTDYADSLLCVRQGIALFQDKKIAVVRDDAWRNAVSTRPLSIDFLYLSGAFKGKMADLQSVFQPKTVVLDASLGTWRTNRLRHECDSLGMAVHSLADDGALRARLN